MYNYLAFIFNLEDKQLLQEVSYRQFKKLEKIFLFLLIISVFLNILEENFFFEHNFSVTLSGAFNLETQFGTNEPDSSRILRIINLILMISLMFVLYLRKKAYFLFMKSISMFQFSKPLLRSWSLFQLLLEFSFIAIQAYPGMLGSMSAEQRQWHIIYLDDTILTFLCFVIRICFIFRSLLYMTRFSSPKAMKICFDNGVDPGLIFSLKAEFHHVLKLFVFAFLLLILLNNGILLRLCERSAQIFSDNDWDYLWNSFWCIIVTLTTVGYGDIVPTTDNGRVMVGITAILGSMITSMICIIFMIEFNFTQIQENAYERIKASECTLKLSESASKCIGLAARFSLKVKKATKEERTVLSDIFFVDIKKKVSEFRAWKKTIVDFKHYKKMDRRLLRISEDFNEHLDELSVLMGVSDLIDMKLDFLMNNQKTQEKHLIFIENYYQNMIYQLDKFSEDYLKHFFNKLIDKHFEKEKNLLENSQTNNPYDRIPLIQITSPESSFQPFQPLALMKVKPRSFSGSKSKIDDTKIRKSTLNLEKQINIRKSRKSVFMTNPLMEFDKIFKKKEEPLSTFSGKNVTKKKKLSVLSKNKKIGIKNKDKIEKIKELEKIKKSDNIEKNGETDKIEKIEKNNKKLDHNVEEKSLSFRSSNNVYPSLDEISNYNEPTIYNYYLKDTESIQGSKIEREQQDENEEQSDDNKLK